MGWVTKFDNTFWNGYTDATWTGSEWDGIGMFPNDFSDLQPIGTWATGYRPTSIRITVSTSIPAAFDLTTFPGSVIVGHLSTNSTPTVFTFSLSLASDLTFLELDEDGTAAGAFNLVWHNIEFFDAAGPTAFWQDKIKCTETDT